MSALYLSNINNVDGELLICRLQAMPVTILSTSRAGLVGAQFATSNNRKGVVSRPLLLCAFHRSGLFHHLGPGPNAFNSPEWFKNNPAYYPHWCSGGSKVE